MVPLMSVSTKKKTLFISDLHLQANHPVITNTFLKLLQSTDSSVDGLYILGDLFETWIGDDDDSPFHQQIIQAMQAATQRGLKIYFMAGNRDFLIGKKFLQETGCHLLSEEEKINLYGIPVLLMHGDTLCTKDIAYLKWREKCQTAVWRNLFLLLPLSVRRYIATKLRAKSAAYTKSMQSDDLDATPDEVIRVMKKHHVLTLIHGHTHRPAMHELLVDGAAAMRIVLDAWHDHGSVLVWDENGEKELIEI